MPSTVRHMNMDRRQRSEAGGRRRSDDPAHALFHDNGPFASLRDPVLLFDGPEVSNGNAPGLKAASDPDLVADLFAIVKTVQASQQSERLATAVSIDGREALIDFDIMPWNENRAIAIGRDISITAGIQDALRVSRERYRSLLSLSADCIWETDAAGRLSLISPNDIFGRPAALFIGQPVQMLLTATSAELFSGKDEPEWIPAAIEAADGELMLGAAIMEPIYDPETGEKTGVRGCFRQKYGVSNR